MSDNQQLLQQVLQRYGLAGANIQLIRSYNNDVYRIETADHRRFGLRVCGFLNMKRRAMEDEMTWLAFVAQRNPRLAPRPIANDQGELVTAIDTPAGERLCALFVWVEGTVLQGVLTAAELHNLGRSVATLHNIARQFTFPDATCDFRSGYCYDQALMLNHRDWIDKHRPVIGPERIALLQRAVEYVMAELEQIGTTPANYGMIHADLSIGNLLVQDGEIYIIDFEQLGRGHFLYDLAVLRNELLSEAAGDATRWSSFVAGYGEVAEWPLRQEAELQPFIITTQLNFLDWFYNSMNPTVLADQEHLVPSVYESIRRMLV